jgi:hypothetical protein
VVDPRPYFTVWVRDGQGVECGFWPEFGDGIGFSGWGIWPGCDGRCVKWGGTIGLGGASRGPERMVESWDAMLGETDSSSGLDDKNLVRSRHGRASGQRGNRWPTGLGRRREMIKPSRMNPAASPRRMRRIIRRVDHTEAQD